jgi:prepilin-type N-terminal cleavage/methylation domain-containing protein
MTHPSINPAPNARDRHAFTLVEILVVISIIAVLVAITTMVGTSVVNSGKNKATLGILQTLDSALAAYIDTKGDNPPALVAIPYANLPASIQNQYQPDEVVYYPAIDGRGREGTSGDLIEVNSVALFIESVKTVPETQDLVNSINPRYIKNYSADENIQPFLLTAFDAWDNPIRYVHPKFDGIIERERRALMDAGEPLNIINPNKPFFVAGALPVDAANVVRMNFVRRNRLIDADFGEDGLAGGGGGLNLGTLSDFELVPDSDGGLTSGNRPYFYSAGPDGNPATLEDNIYITPPQHADPGVN